MRRVKSETKTYHIAPHSLFRTGYPEAYTS